ncbi:maleylacetate reductase [Sinirhodobacter sp. WL0062]|uniref:Maleylacetate reductase n=1 Tax=Rhodobacter flavimaris TaxID=2907145 RepID=A0ABS8YTE3_9RHOB|nr:maleylacetate reductase [Sinirhodobacter sp. WL0062]MCE5973139.1 maleylacetate reductase [Sinirhodobacter sp. WL0062]
MTGIAPFQFSINPGRIVFGPGSLAQAATEIERLGCKRVLIVATAFQKNDAEALAEALGPQAAGVFAEAAMHTPVEVTEKAMAAYAAAGADGVLTYGGGSTIGLGKAIAWRNDAPQIVVATTYAGSEVTPILGQTEKGLKTTLRDPKVLPKTVIYDPELTLGLPVAMSVASGLNAMAHAVEGLYAQDRNPVSSLQATEGIRALRAALPVIVRDPSNRAARGEALYGAWLCGTVLGTVGMSLHHKLCHVLGGSFDLPHAETHAIMLPHTAAFNAAAAADALAPAAALFGGAIGAGLYDFASSIGAPKALRDLGLLETDLDRAADIAVKNPYWNPRPVERDGIRALLQRAWEGARPE